MTYTTYYSIKTGEQLNVVEIPNSNCITIYYNEKIYRRNKDIIGKTIFKSKYTISYNNRLTADNNKLVTIRECGTDNINKFVLRKEYKRYIPTTSYGVGGDWGYRSEKYIDKTPVGNYEPLNINTYLGKSIYGHSIGHTFMAKNEKLEMSQYEIIDIM